MSAGGGQYKYLYDILSQTRVALTDHWTQECRVITCHTCLHDDLPYHAAGGGGVALVVLPHGPHVRGVVAAKADAGVGGAVHGPGLPEQLV